jgi:hypothetical protein
LPPVSPLDSIPIVPFTTLFGDDMVRDLGEMSEEQVESLVGTLTRRNEGNTKVLRVDDL